jgi:catechol 2,3-dioxygenase-like lactoylglutathione lyase family enzyme
MEISTELQTGVTRDIYGMPAFVTLVVPDVRAAAAWFTRSLDFVELFAMPPGDDPVLIHLRRWRFQDILIRRGEASDDIGGGIQLSLAADFDELDALAARARAGEAHVEGPTDTDWNTRDLAVITPQGLHLVLTARRPEMLRDQTFTENMERWNAEQSPPTD